MLHPYKLESAFFISLKFERISEVPMKLQLKYSVDIKSVDEENQKRLQIFLRFRTHDDQPVNINIELVGIFKLADENLVPDKKALNEFIFDQAIYILWPNISEIVKQITVLMGLNPIQLPLPYNINFENKDLV